ncbi:MAG: hypothetical protein AB8F95_15325, partial [Bacteroidia bacterium]
DCRKARKKSPITVHQSASIEKTLLQIGNWRNEIAEKLKKISIPSSSICKHRKDIIAELKLEKRDCRKTKKKSPITVHQSAISNQFLPPKRIFVFSKPRQRQLIWNFLLHSRHLLLNSPKPFGVGDRADFLYL